MVTPIAARIEQRLVAAWQEALRLSDRVDPMLRRSDRADFQANGLLALARQLGGNPRELAATLSNAVPVDELIAKIEVSGPGFLEHHGCRSRDP